MSGADGGGGSFNFFGVPLQFGSRDTDLNKRQRREFERAGGNVIGHAEGAPRGRPRYEWEGERISKNEARAILRAIRAGAIPNRPSPVDSLPPLPTYNPQPPIFYGQAQPIPFPTDPERVKRERARRKAEQAAKKAKGKARAAKKPTWLEILNKIPMARRLTRFWGPTGILYGAQKVWRKREKYFRDYQAWEAKQPINRGQVTRAPAPGVIPRAATYAPRSVRRGPLTRYTPGAVPLPSKGPRTRPVIQPQPMLVPRPRGIPQARPVSRPNVSTVARPASRPAPSSRTWPAPSSSPTPSPGTAKPRLPAWLTGIAVPTLMAYVSRPPGAPRFRIGNISGPGVAPGALTGFQSYPLPLASPRTDPAKCKCPKPKKRQKGNTCRNPVVSRRKRMSGGRTLITTTRWQKCRA